MSAGPEGKGATPVVPVVVAGGSGTRLWPLSRESFPKQFLAIFDDWSLLQHTLLRFGDGEDGFGCSNPVLVCNEAHRFLARDQAEKAGVPTSTIILEPAGRGTAPALTLAALRLGETDPILVMSPADHYIDDVPSLRKCLQAACEEADRGRLVTLGIVPDAPETGFGYLRCEAGAGNGKTVAVPLLEFVEKPDEARAREFLATGNYLWNSGIFVMKASVWLDAMARYRPDILETCEAAAARGTADGVFFRPDEGTFLSCAADSVDYAVMEPASTAGEIACRVVPFDGGWSDVGSWSAVWKRGGRSTDNNITRGRVLAMDTQDSMIISQERVVAVLGAKGLIVAETPDAVLVADMTASQSIGRVVSALREQGESAATGHRRVNRPWGSFESVMSAPGYQVKRLTVAPGKQLSLQLHHRRSEHWVVVRGTATVVRGEETLTLRTNESVYIPKETKHRLGNDGEAELEVIEVQTGDYLGEDDIVRFEDDFGRAGRAD